MQFLMLAEDGSYVPRPRVDEVEPAPGDADDVPGPDAAEVPAEAPGHVVPDVPGLDLRDPLEVAMVQSAVLESIMEDNETGVDDDRPPSEHGVDPWASFQPSTEAGVPGRE